ncbi:hypothetical protein ACROYT_G005002 [Oculina patagonica]
MNFKVRTINRTAKDELGSNVEKNAKVSNDDNRETNNGKMKKVETLKCFLMDTTLHGARFVFAESLLRRCLWKLALVASFAFCCYQAYCSWRQFFQRPFNTRMSSKNALEGALTFPAVTLCNFNPQNAHRVMELQYYNFSAEEMELKLDDVSKLLQLSKRAITDDFRERNPEFFNREEMVNSWKLASHQIEEMLLPHAPPTYTSCSFDGLLCSAENFSNFASTSFGQCFTFNLARNSSKPLKARMAGKNYGLKLRMNIQRDAYFRNPLRPFVGITVLVHKPNNFPFMDEYGLAVEPGKHSFLSIKMKRITNLPSPYATNCTQRRLNMFTSGTSYDYSKPACLMQCRNEFVVNKCQCTLMEIHAKAQVCALNDTVLCVIPALEAFSLSKESHKCEHDCPQPCKHVEYETSLSHAGLQGDVFEDHLLSFLNASQSSSASSPLYKIYRPFLNMTKSERQDYIDKNIVSLDIYFNDLNYDELEQFPTFELWDLSASLGGNQGLFLGISYLTVCEFLDYGFRRLYHKMFSERNDANKDESSIPG